MITLNECRVDAERKKLIVEASIENLEYFKDVYIESIVIDTDETYMDNGPSSNPVYSLSLEEDHTTVTSSLGCRTSSVEVYTDTETGPRSIRLVISNKELGLASLKDNVFFVYVIAAGLPAIDTPCGIDTTYIVGVAADLKPIYDSMMHYIKEVENKCDIPKDFIDSILRLKAFTLALETGNYTAAIKYWQKFLKNKSVTAIEKGCGCNGT